MKPFNLLLTAAMFSTGCAHIPEPVKAAFTTPTPVKVEHIVLMALSEKGALCYSLPNGMEVRTDGTLACEVLPKEAEVALVLKDVAKKFHLTLADFEGTALFYTGSIIDCDGAQAMGCSQLFDKENAMSVVSLYYPWRRAILRHELTHVALSLTDAPAMRHFCLDNPSFCGEDGELLPMTLSTGD